MNAHFNVYNITPSCSSAENSNKITIAGPWGVHACMQAGKEALRELGSYVVSSLSPPPPPLSLSMPPRFLIHRPVLFFFFFFFLGGGGAG